MAGRTVRPEFEGTAAQKESCWRAIGRPAGGCRKRGPCIVRRRDGAPKGAASSQKEDAQLNYLTRLLGAPSPRISRGTK